MLQPRRRVAAHCVLPQAQLASCRRTAIRCRLSVTLTLQLFLRVQDSHQDFDGPLLPRPELRARQSS